MSNDINNGLQFIKIPEFFFIHLRESSEFRSFEVDLLSEIARQVEQHVAALSIKATTKESINRSINLSLLTSHNSVKITPYLDKLIIEMKKTRTQLIDLDPRRKETLEPELTYLSLFEEARTPFRWLQKNGYLKMSDDDIARIIIPVLTQAMEI